MGVVQSGGLYMVGGYIQGGGGGGRKGERERERERNKRDARHSHLICSDLKSVISPLYICLSSF